MNAHGSNAAANALLDDLFGTATDADGDGGAAGADALAYDDPARFLTEQLYIPETHGTITLHPEQEAVIRALFEREPETGHFRYSTIVYSSIKKSAKTTIGGGLALWQGWRIPYGEIYIVGNDLKQADNRMMKAIRYCILNNPRMRDRAEIVRNTVRLDNGTKIEAVAVDPAGEAGGNPTGIFWTEAWGAKQKKHEEMWSEMALSPTRQGHSFKFVESYAGHTGESNILERLYIAGVKQGQLLDPEISPELYTNGRTAVYWNTRRYLKWQQENPEYYAQEAIEKTPAEFRRQHDNEWVSSESAFLDSIVWWDNCRGELPPLRDKQAVVVALDAAVSGDCFAIVGVSREGERTALRFARKWTPPTNGVIDYADVETYIRWVAKTFNVVEFAYDPYQLHDMTQRLQREGVGWFRPFPQGADRLVADKHLYDTIRDRRIIHDGGSEANDVREHANNANRKDDDNKLRIIKRAEHLKIDLAVALSMSNYEAKRLNIG